MKTKFMDCGLNFWGSGWAVMGLKKRLMTHKSPMMTQWDAYLRHGVFQVAGTGQDNEDFSNV
ncbi:hypothetical protein [Desulfocicer vacuolatum]|uniref:hypothetical protein n=1 Tax=Desulfocicer vacuolatum TaxID=2298 RepID=UPI000A05C97B|nr:hypothetical protein [Desulfocicer vacuolatum]